MNLSSHERRGDAPLHEDGARRCRRRCARCDRGLALPAIGDSGATGTDQGLDVSNFAACLAEHGLPDAPTTGPELKRWLAGKDPGAVGAAIDACKPTGQDASTSAPDAATVIACVRSHGIDAPTTPADFKRWVFEQQQAGRSKALDDALGACKLALTPQGAADGSEKPDCGAPTDKPPAAKPETPGDTNPK